MDFSGHGVGQCFDGGVDEFDQPNLKHTGDEQQTLPTVRCPRKRNQDQRNPEHDLLPKSSFDPPSCREASRGVAEGTPEAAQAT